MAICEARISPISVTMERRVLGDGFRDTGLPACGNNCAKLAKAHWQECLCYWKRREV